VLGLRHELVGLDQREVGQTAEVGLEAPDSLLGVEHRVVVTVGVLELHGQTVRHDLLAGLPGVDTRAGAQNDAAQVGADHVIRQVVLLGQWRDPSVALEKAEGRHGLKDRGPHRVVVDGAGHHGHDRLARAELGDVDLLDVQAPAWVLVPAGQAGEHVDLVLVHRDGAVPRRDLKCGIGFRRSVAGEDRIENGLHRGTPQKRAASQDRDVWAETTCG